MRSLKKNTKQLRFVKTAARHAHGMACFSLCLCASVRNKAACPKGEAAMGWPDSHGNRFLVSHKDTEPQRKKRAD
jgi:hypothetical protein